MSSSAQLPPGHVPDGGGFPAAAAAGRQAAGGEGACHVLHHDGTGVHPCIILGYTFRQ